MLGNTIREEEKIKLLNYLIKKVNSLESSLASQVQQTINDLISGGNIVVNGGGLSDEAKRALLSCFEHVAYIDTQGQTYYDALEDALFDSGDNGGDNGGGNDQPQPKTLLSISAVFTQGNNEIYNTDSLDTLKQYLVVTANYDDNSSDTISTGYVLSGTLTQSTSTITVSYQGKTTTFDVTVTQMQVCSITNSLTGCSSSNNAASVNEGSSYLATITPNTGYTLTGANVSVTMGGVDITSSAYNNGTISIASVTGNVVITILAEVVSGTWVDLDESMFTATRSDVTINSDGFIHQENIVVTTPETKYPEILLDSRIIGLDFDIDNTGAHTWLILVGTKDNYGAIALTQTSGGYPAEMHDGQTGKTTGLGGTKLNGCPYGNGHYTVTRNSSEITISKTGGASVTYTIANQPLHDYGNSASWIFGFCIQPSSPTGNGYKNIKVMFGNE